MGLGSFYCSYKVSYYFVTNNFEGAFPHLKKLAEKHNHTKAQAALSIYYILGIGMPVDLKQAIMWIRKSANSGCEVGQFALAEVYLRGIGVDIDYAEAMHWFKLSADQNYGSAMYMIGYMYQFGYGVAIDQQQAFEWYLKGAKKDDSDAQYQISFCYANGINVDVDIKKAEKYLGESLKGGSTLANVYNGIGYLNGFNEDQSIDYTQAMTWFKKAENKIECEAFLSLGYMYENGLNVDIDLEQAENYFQSGIRCSGTTGMFDMGAAYIHSYRGQRRNFQQAMYWFEKISEKGYIDALLAIGSMYLSGLGCKSNLNVAYTYFSKAVRLEHVTNCLDQIYPDGIDFRKECKQAIKWYYKTSESEETVEKGCIYGLSWIGYMYEKGLGVQKDSKKALVCYSKALGFSYGDDSDANMCIGLLYSKGLGVEQDHVKAMEFFQKSALYTNTYVYNIIGDAYRNGNGVEKDYHKSMEWYLKGVKYHDAYSQFNVGKMYLEGLGVVENSDIALKWFLKSRDGGCQDAEHFIIQIQKKFRKTKIINFSTQIVSHIESKFKDEHVKALAQSIEPQLPSQIIEPQIPAVLTELLSPIPPTQIGSDCASKKQFFSL